MAAKRNQRKQAEKKALPLAAMIISFMVGGFVVFLIHIKDSASPDKTIESPVAKAAEKSSKAIEPTFEFFTLLPEMETVVDEPRQAKKKRIVSSPPQKTANLKSLDKASYLIQAGSFKSAKDADGRKAKLALLGVESKVQTVKIDNKATWHRVQIGPIVGRDKVEMLQKQLKKNKIEYLLLRAKHG